MTVLHRPDETIATASQPQRQRDRPPSPRYFTRAEYFQMAEIGIFHDERVELIKGEILQMSPQNSPHVQAISMLLQWLVPALGKQFTIRCQAPIAASNSAAPEPDIAVVAGPVELIVDHPNSALLIIEIADTSLRHDRRKASLYASVAVPEYWIANLRTRSIEIYRKPIPDQDAEFGFRYAEVSNRAADEAIEPASLAIAPVTVATLLPRVTPGT
jgi:Uma2 family endonuclease